MLLTVEKSEVTGSVKIPGSKSHTIRALYFASLAEGPSEIIDPLDSADTRSAIAVCTALGAQVLESPQKFRVTGFGGKPAVPAGTIDVGNSGTSLRIGVAVAALADQRISFTGDHQIQSRPMGPLIRSLRELGAEVVCERNNDMAPLWVKGPLRGGRTELEAISSQFLTALLVACPLCAQDSEILLTKLNEKPYVEMTLRWLNDQGIKYRVEGDIKSIKVYGGQKYRRLMRTIPADFSSATFFMVQAAISGRPFVLENLDMDDSQGDKAVLQYLKDMGARVDAAKSAITVTGGRLVGKEIDMNATPDALPAMAVAGCFAEGETVLKNVPQARLKETDRIHVMCEELRKMGANIRELSDGLIIQRSSLHAAEVRGHSDHRVVMALAIAGLNVEGRTTIDTAEAVGITFPNFVELMNGCGAKMSYVQ